MSGVARLYGKGRQRAQAFRELLERRMRAKQWLGAHFQVVRAGDDGPALLLEQWSSFIQALAAPHDLRQEGIVLRQAPPQLLGRAHDQVHGERRLEAVENLGRLARPRPLNRITTSRSTSESRRARPRAHDPNRMTRSELDCSAIRGLNCRIFVSVITPQVCRKRGAGPLRPR